ncbi:organic cation transporter protein-like [Glandiceps talaboti]
MLQYDDILKNVVGEFGLYQKRCVFFLCLTMVPVAMRITSQVFMLASTDHWCSVPESVDLIKQCELLNITDDCAGTVWSLLVPTDKDETTCQSGFKRSRCKRYNYNGTDFDALWAERDLNTSYDLISCHRGWTYDTSQYMSTAIHEFDLVCDDGYQVALVTSIFMLGNALGNIIFGPLSDRIGRLKTLMVTVIVGFVSAIVTELVGPSKRAMVGVLCNLFFGFGYTGIAILAYFIRDWRHLKFAFNVPCIIFLVYWCFIPESPRWLLSKGKIDKAKKIIRKTARVNNVPYKKNLFNTQNEELPTDKASYIPGKNEEVNQVHVSPLEIFRYPNMRKKCCILLYVSFSTGIVYYGFIFNTSNIGGSDYINAGIAGAVEIPAYITIGILIETRLGRRLTYFILTILCGVLSLATIFTPTRGHLLWIRILLSSMGKFVAGGVHALNYIYSGELYPTVVRSFGASFTSMFGLIGAFLAPQILISRILWQHLPQLVFCILPTISAFLALHLPETRGRKLPDTMEEGESFVETKLGRWKDKTVQVAYREVGDTDTRTDEFQRAVPESDRGNVISSTPYRKLRVSIEPQLFCEMRTFRQGDEDEDVQFSKQSGQSQDKPPVVVTITESPEDK